MGAETDRLVDNQASWRNITFKWWQECRTCNINPCALGLLTFQSVTIIAPIVATMLTFTTNRCDATYVLMTEVADSIVIAVNGVFLIMGCVFNNANRCQCLQRKIDQTQMVVKMKCYSVTSIALSLLYISLSTASLVTVRYLCNK